MYALKEATCDCCRTVYRCISKKHYCSHCDKYYYICSRCQENTAHCPSCGIALKRKTPPAAYVQSEFGFRQTADSPRHWRERFAR